LCQALHLPFLPLHPKKIMKRSLLISPLNAREAAEFRAYWKTGPTIQDACAKYLTTRLRMRAILAELDLEPSPPRARPQRTSNITLVTDASLARRIAGKEEQGSIADRFRTLDQVKLNPYR
jgi:hypothetical protein